MSHLVAPSILSANFAHLAADCEMVNASKADWFHVDVMDGVFVPNISFGFPVIKAIKSYSEKPLDVHLMIVEPEKYIADFREAGANILTVHYEACTHLHRTIQQIGENQMSPGVALNPHTPVQSIKDVARELSLVCLMSVNPGFGGQAFIQNTCNKLRELVQLREETKSDFLIEIDGGVNSLNASKLISLGADVLVAGSHVFKSESPIDTITELKKANDYQKA